MSHLWFWTILNHFYLSNEKNMVEESAISFRQDFWPLLVVGLGTLLKWMCINQVFRFHEHSLPRRSRILQLIILFMLIVFPGVDRILQLDNKEHEQEQVLPWPPNSPDLKAICASVGPSRSLCLFHWSSPTHHPAAVWYTACQHGSRYAWSYWVLSIMVGH